MNLSDHERALARLIRDAHRSSDYQLPDLFDDYAQHLGVTRIVVYLIDLQQRVLVQFAAKNRPGDSGHLQTLDVASTSAGYAYQQSTLVREEIFGAPRSLRVWLPLLDGVERLGVLGVTVAEGGQLDADGGALTIRLLTFASLAAGLTAGKTLHGDTIVRLRRRRSMELAAEKRWAMFPPLAFGNQDVTISGAVEPAYGMGGDTLDYAVDPHTAHLAIFDGMGHGVRSAQLAAMALSAYRNARRSGHDLPLTVRLIDEAIAESFPDSSFLTGQVAQLNTDTGILNWISAGHPPPLLIRRGSVISQLHLEPGLPLGLGSLTSSPPLVGTIALGEGDLVLFYSDGVVDARSSSGAFFGLDKFISLATAHFAARAPGPETLRRIIQALLDGHDGNLEDDATLLLVQFRPGKPAWSTPWTALED